MNNNEIHVVMPLSTDDIPLWLALSREYDQYIQHLIADVSIFYRGFDTYMLRKIQQREAFMVTESVEPKSCCGVIAFSRTVNRITFFGVAHHADFEPVGTALIQYALSQLDRSRDITVSVMKGDADVFQREKRLFEDMGFIEQDGTVMEEGIPVFLLRLSPTKAS